MKITLPIADAELVLEGEDWCAVSLLQGSSSIRLGAESRSVLASRLIANIISPAGQPSGEINGCSAYWVASLAEEHFTLYAHFLAGLQRRIFVQSLSGAMVWSGLLTQEQLQLWQQRLTPYA
ncbi:MAG: hypothetical protein Q7U94_01590 [Sideroxyarcus sp.]|nr:hypothetical protein [Sideroxyarcus sp.]